MSIFIFGQNPSNFASLPFKTIRKLYNPYCHKIGTPLYKKGKSEKPFSCSLCRRSFSENYKLENHVAFVHEEKKSVGCQICRMKFKKLTVLNKHIESEHLSENSQGVFENPDDLFDDTDDLFDDTGKSFSEALILASTHPQYDKRLFIEL